MVSRNRNKRSSNLLGIRGQITDGSHPKPKIIDRATAQMLDHEISNMYSVTFERCHFNIRSVGQGLEMKC